MGHPRRKSHEEKLADEETLTRQRMGGGMLICARFFGSVFLSVLIQMRNRNIGRVHGHGNGSGSLVDADFPAQRAEFGGRGEFVPELHFVAPGREVLNFEAAVFRRGCEVWS